MVWIEFYKEGAVRERGLLKFMKHLKKVSGLARV